MKIKIASDTKSLKIKEFFLRWDCLLYKYKIVVNWSKTVKLIFLFFNMLKIKKIISGLEVEAMFLPMAASEA